MNTRDDSTALRPEALRSLLESATAVVEGLDVEQILVRIVEAARAVTQARYAACGVPGEGGFLHFIYRGISADEATAIGRPPQGTGLLGHLLTATKPLRVDSIESHDNSSGFPPHHPPMQSLLGVPIIQQGRNIGDIYLTDKVDGQPFSDEDEAAVEILAHFAGVALTNAHAHLRVSETLQQRTLELDATNTRLRDLSRRVLSILEAERQQVAQDLHDGLGQLLAGALLSVHSLTVQQPDLAPTTASIEDIIHEAVQEVRRISHGLRPAILDELGPEAAIRTMIGQMPAEWTERIAFSAKGERRRLDDGVDTALYRIAQEALTNITRHSKATSVRMELAYGATSVRLVVQDNGVGMNPDADGFGITSMRERASLVGGSVTLQSAAGQGVRLTFDAPAPREDD